MKKVKGLQKLALLMCFAMMMSLMFYTPKVHAEGKSIISSISVSNNTPEIGEEVTFTCKFNTTEEIAYVSFNIMCGYGDFICSCATIQKMDGETPTNEYYTCMNMDYYGIWYIQDIEVYFSNGTRYVINDVARPGFMEADEVYDFSSVQAVVKQNFTGEDTKAPEISSKGFSVSTNEPQINEQFYITMPVTDDKSGVASVDVMMSANNNKFEYATGAILEDDQWKMLICAERAGLYQIKSVLLTDRCGNKQTIYNSKYVGYNNEKPAIDMSGADFLIPGYNDSDKTGPIINSKNFSVSAKDVSLRTPVSVYLDVKDADSDISQVYVDLKLGKGMMCSCATLYDEEKDLYVIPVSTDYYGRYEISRIYAVDVCGNYSSMVNTAYPGDDTAPFDQGPTTNEDLSAYDFNVGIFDESNSGIFVSGNGMDADCTLDVESKDESGTEYEAIIKGESVNASVEGYYEIEVDGTYDDGGEKVKVQFDVKKLKNGSKIKDGDKIRIKHKRKNGTIDIEDVEVRNGKIWMYVSDFSPFMVLSGCVYSDVGESTVLGPIDVRYITHIQTYGWQGNENDTSTWSKNGVLSGTVGESKRLEGIKISLANKGTDLGIQYTTHCQSYGWLPWSANGEMNGTEGEAKRLEAIKIQLTGTDKDKYDVYYRVHAQSYGWLGWASNGAPAGTAGYAKRLEGIQIVIVKKGESFDKNIGKITSARNEAYIALPGTSPVVGGYNTDAANPFIPGESTTNVAYKTHVQTYGWQGWKYNGAMSGTSGEAKRLEGINIKLANKQFDGGIAYTTHVQTYGWQGDINNPSTWKKDGEMSGTSGEAKRLEAICITLTGDMAKYYDVYYRVHAQTYGWLGWAKNGAPSGTAGYAKRLEGIQVVLVPKGGAAPVDNYGGVTSTNANPYIQK